MLQHVKPQTVDSVCVRIKGVGSHILVRASCLAWLIGFRLQLSYLWYRQKSGINIPVYCEKRRQLSIFPRMLKVDLWAFYIDRKRGNMEGTE